MKQLNPVGEGDRRGFRSSPADRRRVVEEFARSGLTQAAFAQRVGISAWTLGRWRAQAALSGQVSPKAAERVQVQVFDPIAGAAVTFEVVVGTQFAVRVPARFDEQELRRLLAALRESC